MKIDSAAFTRGLADALRAEIEEEEDNLLDVAQRMMARAQQLVPVDEGQLQEAIDITEGRLSRKGYYVEVGVRSRENEYALPIEFGTHDAAAQPFMRPAYYEAADELS